MTPGISHSPVVPLRFFTQAPRESSKRCCANRGVGWVGGGANHHTRARAVNNAWDLVDLVDGGSEVHKSRHVTRFLGHHRGRRRQKLNTNNAHPYPPPPPPVSEKKKRVSTVQPLGLEIENGIWNRIGKIEDGFTKCSGDSTHFDSLVSYSLSKYSGGQVKNVAVQKFKSLFLNMEVELEEKDTVIRQISRSRTT
jgi:hypothetical protein